MSEICVDDSPVKPFLQGLLGANDEEFYALLALIHNIERWKLEIDFKLFGGASRITQSLSWRMVMSQLVYEVIEKLAIEAGCWEVVVLDLFDVKLIPTPGKGIQIQTMIDDLGELLIDPEATFDQVNATVEKWWADLYVAGELPEEYYREKAEG